VHQKGLVFVIEPNDLILGLLERWVGEAGYTMIVGTSQSLVEAAEKGEKPDLVVIDVPVPRNSERTIKFVSAVHAGPILLLSARFTRGMRSSISVARQLGVRNVLPIPFTRSELLSALTESMQR
jgi:DNA-binding response OmpR family regulator